MKVYHSISAFNGAKKTIVTLGTFDGVHLGHQKIIDRLIESARKEDAESLLLTFTKHPRMYLESQNEIKLLNTNEEKRALLEEKGLDHLIFHPFDETFSKLSGEEFVKNYLVDHLKIKKIIIGYDHRFGNNRSSDINDLLLFGKKYGFDVEQISAREVNEISISSTKIRMAIKEGDLKTANAYLGYIYAFTATVVKGDQLGRTIGFPTANLAINDCQKKLPKIGVYSVLGFYKNNYHIGMMNIGFRPTLQGKKISIEVNFFNIDEDLYDQNITIKVYNRLRDEIKFESIDKLKEQLQKDKINTVEYFSTINYYHQ